MSSVLKPSTSSEMALPADVSSATACFRLEDRCDRMIGRGAADSWAYGFSPSWRRASRSGPAGSRVVLRAGEGAEALRRRNRKKKRKAGAV